MGTGTIIKVTNVPFALGSLEFQTLNMVNLRKRKYKEVFPENLKSGDLIRFKRLNGWYRVKSNINGRITLYDPWYTKHILDAKFYLDTVYLFT